jgi:anti-sigma factor RsiW
VDGEFSPEENAEVKAHLEACPTCARAVRVHESYRAALQRANSAAPHTLHDAVRAGLNAEGSEGRWARALRDPRAVGLAAALVGAAAWFLAGGLSHPVFPRGHNFAEDGAALHARALPLDYTASDVNAAQRWLASKVDFGVQLPRLGPVQGVRLSNVHSRQAAVVTYNLPTGRVSLLIVDDPDQQLPGAARTVQGREVWLSQARGFNVASWRNDEIVYSLISDLSERDILRLVQAAETR